VGRGDAPISIDAKKRHSSTKSSYRNVRADSASPESRVDRRTPGSLHRRFAPEHAPRSTPLARKKSVSHQRFSIISFYISTYKLKQEPHAPYCRQFKPAASSFPLAVGRLYLGSSQAHEIRQQTVHHKGLFEETRNLNNSS